MEGKTGLLITAEKAALGLEIRLSGSAPACKHEVLSSGLAPTEKVAWEGNSAPPGADLATASQGQGLCGKFAC